jgi:glycosyltransferase involved in cell wall biosynthesis
MASGGPRFIVRDGACGFIASDDAAFGDRAVTLARDGGLRRGMAAQARRQVEGQSWDRVFAEVYDGYARLPQPM